MFCPFKLFPAAYAKGKTRADWIRKKIAGGFSCTDYTDLEREINISNPAKMPPLTVRKDNIS